MTEKNERPEAEAAVADAAHDVPEAPPAEPAQAEAAAPQPALDELVAAVREQAAEVLEVARIAAKLGVDIDGSEAVRKGVGADALRRRVLETLAARAEAADVRAVVPPEPKGDTFGEALMRAVERINASRE